MARISKVKTITIGFIIFFICGIYFYIFYMPENYMWQPSYNNYAKLEKSCYLIITTKTILWALFYIFIYYTLTKFNIGRWKWILIFIIVYIIGFFFIRTFDRFINANNFYNIFINQSVSEDYILVPIIDGGYFVGKYLNNNILDTNMMNRRYAIEGLGLIKYKPAIENLESIIENNDTEDYIKESATKSLFILNSD